MYLLTLIVSIQFILSHSFIGDAPKIIPFLFPPDLTVDTPVVVVSCIISSGDKPISFTWLKNNIQLHSQESKLKITNHAMYSTLELQNLAGEDIGNYTCRAENSFGSDTYSAILQMKVAASWDHQPKDVKIAKGKRLAVNCSAFGFPLPKVKWSLLTRFGQEKFISYDNLIIDNVNEHHKGKYKCEANNGIGSAISKIISINIFVPAKFMEKSETHSVKKGYSLKLECYATGDQPLSISWIKNSKQISKWNSERYEIFETLAKDGIKSELMIRSADRNDEGLYVCEAENEFGKDEKINKVHVIEPPSSPTNVVVHQSWSESVSISWNAPLLSNAPILGYIIQYWKDGGSRKLQEENVTMSQTSFMIKNLKPGSSYKVSVVAYNEVGRGKPSDAVKFKTSEDEPKGTPLDVVVEPRGPTTIKVSWRPPPLETWNGEILGYYVGYKQASDYKNQYSLQTVASINSNQSIEHFLYALNKDTQYCIIVKAYNRAGTGPDSQEICVKTTSGDLPHPPMIEKLSTLTESIIFSYKINRKLPIPITSLGIHYRAESEPSWRYMSILIPEDKDKDEYNIHGLNSNTYYLMYITASNEVGNSDPSPIVRVKTMRRAMDALSDELVDEQGAFDYLISHSTMITVISITTAVVIVAIVIIIAFVCVRKAQLEAAKPNFDFCATTLPGSLGSDKSAVYAGNIQRYSESDKTKPLLQGNIIQMDSVFPSHYPTPYSTLPIQKDKNGKLKIGSRHIYDCPQ